jgi:nondiscriminating aspartyl-tRNA synthetase
LERIRTTEVAAHVGERVQVAGWLNTLRRLGGITFLVIRDGWGTVQAVAQKESDLAPLTDVAAGVESVLTVEGTVASSPQAPGGFELQDIIVGIITPVTEPPPLTLSKREIKAAQPTLLDHAVIANRHVTRQALLRLGAGIMMGFRRTLDAHGFTEIQTPKIVESATESGANVFKLDYFGRPGYLAQSPQFYKQIMVGVFERVYEVGPVFRAEPHDTTRHINEPLLTLVSFSSTFGIVTYSLPPLCG